MTKRDIIAKIAEERRVEMFISRICKSNAAELADLSQMIYLALLEKSEETIQDFWNQGSINFLIVRIIKNQWFTSHSPFRDMFQRYSRKAVDLDAAFNIADNGAEDTEYRPRHCDVQGDKGRI